MRSLLRRVFLPHLDPEDQDDEIAIIQDILAVTGKSWEESCEGEDAREEKAHPTKAGDYKKAFMAFTAVQRIFKEEMDAYDRERSSVAAAQLSLALAQLVGDYLLTHFFFPLDLML
ncbi:hypothetical protein EDC04DRAFT_2610637 [Pisolithus marmoratus]|nr:hypothetical protein EDC04DRAFT_2610637 [Pisolithus marmoratus]